MEEKFTWVETYKELAKTLSNYRHRQDELLESLLQQLYTILEDIN